jgi:GxxExxY protein
MVFHAEVADDELTYTIIGIAYQVHNALGPGLPEKVYRDAMDTALTKEGLTCEVEFEIPVIFEGKEVAKRYADLIVEGEVVIELKALKRLMPAHFDQLGVNVGAANVRRGLLLNFGGARVEKQRYVNPAYASDPSDPSDSSDSSDSSDEADRGYRDDRRIS